MTDPFSQCGLILNKTIPKTAHGTTVNVNLYKINF